MPSKPSTQNIEPLDSEPRTLSPEPQALSRTLSPEPVEGSKGAEGSKGDTLSTEPVEVPKGSWVVLELFGHKIIAGLMFKEESLGIPLIRLDVPGTSLYPAFTRHYHPNAVFSITYVNADVVNSISESIQDNPVVAYAPDLRQIARLKDENHRLKQQLDNLHSAINAVSSSAPFSPDVSS